MASTRGRTAAASGSAANTELDFLAGGGEMGARMRAHDWSATPLGPPERWPQSLRTAVSLCLSSRSPILLWWGEQLLELYNDDYRPVLGATKHPRALGAPGAAIWPEIWDIIGPMLDSVMRQGAATLQTDQQLFLDRNGYLEECYFTYAYSPIRDESGGVGGVFSTVFETTERVIGERRLRVLRDLAAQSTGSATAKEACERLIRVLADNPEDVAFAALYVLDPARRLLELTGHCGELPAPCRPEKIALDERAQPWPLSQAIRSGEAQLIALPHDSQPIISPGWSDRITRALVLPVPAQGSATHAAVLVAGVSPRRALDDSYRGFFDLIARQFSSAIGDAQAYEAERRRAQALAEIDRAKTAFFANISHEFRTPLTLIAGPIEELSSDPALPATARARLELAHRNGLRLMKLVNSLLDFSRIEAGRMQASFEPTDLAALTRDVASTFRSAMERAGLTFTVECEELGDPLYIDREMWEKIVLNLLSNAFKFTLQGGVAIRLRRETAHAVLEIADTGIGVPEQELPRLFERFHRVEGASGRTQEGSGIGLALVQELVRLHGGTIDVASEVGRGTTFRVSMPMGTDHLPADRLKAPRSLASTAIGARAFVQEALRWIPADAAETSSRLQILAEEPVPDRQNSRVAGARLLLADDNADMRAYLGELLANSFVVEAVADGEQALEAARRKRPDLIVSDIMMPRLDGLGLLKALRADDALRDIPVILLSARAGEEARVEGLDAGADDYLVKPFSARELLARIGARLELARMRRERDEALREQEEQLRLATDAAEIGLWDVDLISDRLFWPPRVKAMFGISAQVPVSMADFYAQLHPFDRERVSEAFAAAIDSERRTLYDVEYRTVGREDGLIRWVAAKGRGIFDGSGRCVRVIGTAIDITTRKRAEERLSEERRVQELLGKVSHALVAAQLDTERVVQVATDAATELSGAAFGAFFYNIENDQGESYTLYTLSGAPREAFARFPQPRNTAVFGPTFRGEGVVRSADITADPRYGHNAPHHGMPEGHLAVRSYLAVPVKKASGEVLGGLFFGHPEPGIFDERAERLVLAVAAQTAVAFENARLHQASQREVEHRKQVEAALDEANRRKDEFLAMLAHELRNPLAPIGNAGELLSRIITDEGRAKSAIEMIRRQAAQLTRLVDDLLDVSRITQGRIELRCQPVDLAEVITQAVETVGPQLREKRHRISVTLSGTTPLCVSGDFARLVQCVGNLLTNAVKYTEPEGEIWVRARAEGSSAVVEVSDTGAGLAPELLPRVFDLFVQGDRTLDRAHGGLGIGLAVVKQLVQMHHGEVCARSLGLNQGSTFEIRLPRVARSEPVADGRASIARQPRRVLIVDDNRDAAMSLTMLLRQQGHEAQAVFSGVEALERIETFRPEVALLDIGLPGMDGYELARRLRALPQLNGMRLVALTGYGQSEDRERTRAAGFDDHLVKPADLTTIEGILAGVAAGRGK